jgi:putative serine protease PepD
VDGTPGRDIKWVFGIFVLVIASMLAGAGVITGLNALDDDDGDAPSAVTDTGGPAQGASDDGTAGDTPLTQAIDFSDLFERVRPSIVRITTGQDDDLFFDDPTGLGSGVVIDDRGHILTNYHVVRGFNTVTVTFVDGTVAEGEVLGRDPGNDIALVQVEVDDPSVLQPATLGDSASVRVGEPVAAVGNPFGLDGSLTTGVISGIDRTLPSGNDGRPIRRLLQTDAPVNPGNSGGALFNARGEVIGINTAIENPSGNTFAGIAYAVPINTPKRFLTQLVAGDTVEHPRLGISGTTLTAPDAEELGVDFGVAVTTVETGSGADDAGLRGGADGTGDVIVGIDGQPMRTFEELADYIDSKQVGDEVTLQVIRDGEEIELQATLQAWDSTA